MGPFGGRGRWAFGALWEYYSLWRYFEKTARGALMTKDDSNDGRITMEKLPPGVTAYTFVDPEMEARDLAEAAEADAARILACDAAARAGVVEARGLARAVARDGEHAADRLARLPPAVVPVSMPRAISGSR